MYMHKRARADAEYAATLGKINSLTAREMAGIGTDCNIVQVKYVMYFSASVFEGGCWSVCMCARVWVGEGACGRSANVDLEWRVTEEGENGSVLIKLN